ncbi:MAG: GTPase, partial [Patescibacteria group bacterium]
KQANQTNPATPPLRISIIGKPNVGKSSLFNKLIGEERVIVSPIPHTTREPYDTEVTYEYDIGKKIKKQPIIFVDTAGIRRKASVSGELEREGIHKSVESIQTSDIVLFVIDGSETISSQDMQLGGLLERRSKSVILLINKWDLTKDTSDQFRHEVERMVATHFPHLDFAPIIFVSGKTGYRVHQIFPMIMKVWQARHTEIPPQTLTEFMKRIIKEHRPSRGKGVRHPEILGFHQLGSNPPVFEMLIKYRTSIHRSYVEYVENKLREQFDFLGAPIVIHLSKMKR